MTPTAPSLPAEPTPVVIHRGRKVRPVTPREIFQLRQWEMDYRFVREVEYLEREGRVESRYELEKTIGLGRGELLAVRAGKRQIGLVQVAILFEKYRGDRDYIMYGQRNKELAQPYIPGIGRIDRYQPYIFEYTSPARWRIGPRAEAVPEHYPSDPQNLLWTPSEKLPRSAKATKE
jgi:hypothetical protein